MDSTRISIVGASLGAPFAVAVVAEHGVPGLGVIHGYARVPEVIAQAERWMDRVNLCWRGWYASIRSVTFCALRPYHPGRSRERR